MTAFSFKRRFLVPIQVGLGLQQQLPGTEYVPKRQTIRTHRKDSRTAPIGGELQLYCEQRSPKGFLIGRARCIDVQPITLWIGIDDDITVQIGKLLGPRQTKQFVRADGFDNVADMVAFWRAEHGADIQKFSGTITRWEPIT